MKTKLHQAPTRFLIVLLSLFIAIGPVSAAESIAITQVTVINVSDGSRQSDRTVVIEGNRINSIGPSDEVTVPPNADVLDAHGAFLIPGLWDMHVHAAWPGRYERFYPLFLANGVTGFRDTWGVLEAAAAARTAVNDGKLVGPPRTVVAGNLVDGPARIWPGSEVAITPDEGRTIVDGLHAAGAPFIKVYSSLMPETFFAIAERARELDIPFAGHVPEFVRAADASDAGMASMEHLAGLLKGCSTDEQSISAETLRAFREDTETPFSEIIDARNRHILRTFDEEVCKALAASLVDNGTWQVPTLVTNRGASFMPELAAASDERLRYLMPSDHGNWQPDDNRFVRDQSDAKWEHDKVFFARQLELVGFLAEQGVPFLAGSDTPNPWTFPGFSLHDELQLFVEAGMTPLQALQTATLNPARFLERSDELGTVETGKLADLVLLDADPLADIANTKTIRAVIADGRVYRRDELDAILTDIATEAARTSVAEPVYEALVSDGIEAARETYEELRSRRPDEIRFGETELTQLGYRLLGEGNIEAAIAVFEMNIAAYPEAPNPQDSLGDALTTAGKLQAARDAHAAAVRLAEEHGDPRLEAFRLRLKRAEELLESDVDP